AYFLRRFSSRAAAPILAIASVEGSGIFTRVSGFVRTRNCKFRISERLRLLNYKAVGPDIGLPWTEEEAGTNRKLRITCGPNRAQPIVGGIGLSTDIPSLSNVVAG